MVLLGYVDGVEVKFDFYPPNTFKAEIPAQLSGTYILQLKAIDAASNICEYSNIHIVIDFSTFKIKILDKNYTHLSGNTKLYTAKEINLFAYKELVF
jgi:hypothetical protein